MLAALELKNRLISARLKKKNYTWVTNKMTFSNKLLVFFSREVQNILGLYNLTKSGNNFGVVLINISLYLKIEKQQ